MHSCEGVPNWADPETNYASTQRSLAEWGLYRGTDFELYGSYLFSFSVRVLEPRLAESRLRRPLSDDALEAPWWRAGRPARFAARCRLG
jgi:hypothetical protein